MNVDTGEQYLTLREAVDEAESGQTLEVPEDLKLDAGVVIDKALTLISDGLHAIVRGDYFAEPLLEVEGALALGGGGSPTLNGGDTGGSVATVDSGRRLPCAPG
ncbi:MAG: hypothetical protein GX592_12400 [Clostridiales bacterium]|nr:hypothetical protein [Clostridiales bacterium]